METHASEISLPSLNRVWRVAVLYTFLAGLQIVVLVFGAAGKDPNAWLLIGQAVLFLFWGAMAVYRWTTYFHRYIDEKLSNR